VPSCFGMRRAAPEREDSSCGEARRRRPPLASANVDLDLDHPPVRGWTRTRRWTATSASSAPRSDRPAVSGRCASSPSPSRTTPGHAVLAGAARPAVGDAPDETRRPGRELVTRGRRWRHLSSRHSTHAELREEGVDLPEEAGRCSLRGRLGLRDPFGNSVRIAQLTPPPTA
jgi:hypothetical protein